MQVAGAPRRHFFCEALRSLRADYGDVGGALVVREGDPRDAIPELVDEVGATTVSWEIDYSGLAARRDTAMRDSLQKRGIDVATEHGAVLHPPGSITTSTDDTYQVFTYFGRKWLDRPTPRSLDTPATLERSELDPGSIPTHECAADMPDIGTDHARQRLETFCDDTIFRYADEREEPAARSTSRLSADLSFGTIGIREVWETTEDAFSRADSDEERASVEEFQRQLAWREFYAAMLETNPHMIDTNLTTFEHPIEWRNDAEELEAWKHGRTGYPIVDAGMRQLEEEAFMHNRVRMIVASFLTKDLQIDWRKGYRWFRRRLVDHDPANDAGGWQWAASTGTDAQPFFRVFNPMTQGERHDPEAAYIRRYVEELAEVPPDTIHTWTELSASERQHLARKYPAPIVDHQTRREEGLAMYRAARGET